MKRISPWAAVWAYAGSSLLLSAALGPVFAGSPERWPMYQRDPQHTGRADFSVPADRLNATFFDVFAWQSPSPGSPADGGFDTGSMPFFDGAGPGASDLVVGTYHWPKGVIGMNRGSGHVYWSGLPAGGETIGTMTPAFANDGATIYLVNDATGSGAFPAGHPFMAFPPTTGPGTFRHNGASASPDHLSRLSPVVASDGRVFLFAWFDRVYGGTDNGAALTESWAAATQSRPTFSNPALHHDGTLLRVVSGGAGGLIAYHGATGAQLWSVGLPGEMLSTPTIDPASGNVYGFVGNSSVHVVGVTKNGAALWGTATKLAHDAAGGAEQTMGSGCLSHDGATYYFQTVATSGSGGALYAIHASTGTVKWRLPTRSRHEGGDAIASSPIVTANGVLVVGNNFNGTYYAIQDGPSPAILDSLVVSAPGTARASATMSSEGLLYLPLRLPWTIGPSGTPGNGAVNNLFSCLDLRSGATATLFPPFGQIAVSGNQSVTLTWRRLANPGAGFDHYAVYRSFAPFSSVEGMTPVGTHSNPNDTTFTDTGLTNGTPYYHAVTSVTGNGGEIETITGIGPRKPRNETDLQIVSIARTPRYPRYDVAYAGIEVTEPSGFGPYFFNRAVGLGSGQTPATQRWPALGAPVTYTASVRNRGTNTWSGPIQGRWRVDGATVAMPMLAGPLAPDQRATTSHVLNWDGLSHSVEFQILDGDARSANNTLAIDTRSTAFLAYVDRSYLEDFRDAWTPNYPQAATDDMFDWIQRHMTRFNQLFADAGSSKRVHYDALEELRDDAPDPNVNRIDFAIFPFRFHVGNDNFRFSGYYDATEDIDYGYLHEMGHQLGLIDIYRMAVEPSSNQVSGLRYAPANDLMFNVSHVIGASSATAMDHWIDQAHGYFGQYLHGIPGKIKMRFRGSNSVPLRFAEVRGYQYCERPGMGQVITNQIKFSGETDALGYFTLPNVPIDGALVPGTPTGDTLRANPWGYVHHAGTNGTLHFAVVIDGQTDYAWLDLTEANVAYYHGEIDSATFERELAYSQTLDVGDPPPLVAGTLGFANPFRPGAVLTVGLGRTADVEVAIHDVAGRRVRMLARGATTGEALRLSWDGRGENGQALGSGVYFVTARVDAVSSSKRLILMK